MLNTWFKHKDSGEEVFVVHYDKNKVAFLNHTLSKKNNDRVTKLIDTSDFLIEYNLLPQLEVAKTYTALNAATVLIGNTTTDGLFLGHDIMTLDIFAFNYDGKVRGSQTGIYDLNVLEVFNNNEDK